MNTDHQCPSCGGFCRKSGCERLNVEYDIGPNDPAACVVCGDSANTHLMNLLARIHRDGGHYVHDHGKEKAVADADAKIVAWLERDDQ